MKNKMTLVDSKLKMAPTGVVVESISSRRYASQRVYQGEKLKFEAKLKTSFGSELVYVLSNVSGSPAKYLAVDKKTVGEDTLYFFEVPTFSEGNYLVELRFEKAGQVYLDPAGIFKVFVDPQGVSDLRLYTLIPQVTGTIQDWIKALPGIAELGFNAIHLLPVTQMDVSGSPYSAKSHFELDQDLATPGSDVWEDWQTWLKKLQEYRIRLCIDLVFNHVGVESDIVKHQPAWLQRDPTSLDGFKRAGAADGDHWTVWGDLILIDYAHPDPKLRHEIFEHMSAYAKFWGAFAAQTGGMIRLDNLHSGQEDFMEHVLLELGKTYPGLVIFSELFASEQEVARLSWKYGLHLCLSTPWTAPYAYQLRGLIHFLHDPSHVRHLFPLASHDSGAPAQEYGGIEATLARYALVSLLSTGQTGLVQGNEYGYPVKLPFIGRPGKMTFSEHPGLREGIKKINGIHQRYAVFREVGNLRFVDGDHGALVAAYRWTSILGEPSFLVVINLDPKGNHAFTLQSSALSGTMEATQGTLHRQALDLITGNTIDLSSGSVPIQVGPGGFYVFELKV